MTVTVNESEFTRDFDAGPNAQHVLAYNAKNATDSPAAYAAVLAAAPATFQGFPISSIRGKNKGNNIWRVEVFYGLRTMPVETETASQVEFQGSTRGGTQHITHSLSTVNRYTRGSRPATDHKQAIGVRQSGDGTTIDGTDIIVPAYEESLTRYVATASFSAAYKQTLRALTGAVNIADWGGITAGELLFAGADWRTHGVNLVRVDYYFLFADTISGDSIGDITGIDRQGWDYSWVEFIDESDRGSSRLRSVPDQVNVERVYPRAAFTALGIPGLT